jgi:hypothetical protein
MPNIHNEQCEEHRRRIEDVEKVFMVVDGIVYRGSLGRDEFEDAKGDTILDDNR